MLTILKWFPMKLILAIVTLLFVVQNFPLQAQAQLRPANRALERGELQKAMDLAQELLSKKPEDYKTWDLLARVHEAQAMESPVEEYLTHVSEIRASYDKVVEYRSKEEEKVLNRLQFFYMQSFNMGIEEFNEAQSDTNEVNQEEYFQSSAKRFQGSALIFPDSSGAYVNWAYALLGAGDTEGAIEPLSLALEYGGPDLELYSFLSRIYLTSDLEEEAIPVLEEAVASFPGNAELQSYLISAYTEAGQIDRALERYSMAVVDEPENSLYRYNYGSLLLQSEEYDAAMEQLRIAVELDSTYIDAFYNLGAAYINKANTIQAQISELDDNMREQDESLTEDEKQGVLDQIDLLAEERRALYEESIEPLEEAKALAEQEEERSETEICAALFQSYAQTNQMDKAESVSECAGM